MASKPSIGVQSTDAPDLGCHNFRLLQDIRSKFSQDLDAADKLLASWNHAYPGLATVILMDQFARQALSLGHLCDGQALCHPLPQDSVDAQLAEILLPVLKLPAVCCSSRGSAQTAA